MEESLKSKREFFRFSLRKQQLNQEFQKKRQTLKIIDQSKTSTVEIVNQIYSITKSNITSESILECVKLIVNHSNIKEIICQTQFISQYFIQFFCENQYDKNSLYYYLKYLESRLLYDDLAYLWIKEYQLQFINSLALIMKQEELVNQENFNLILSILQSLLIDNSSSLKNYFLYDENELILKIGKLIKQEQFDGLKDYVIEFYYHLILFYRNEEDFDEEELNILLQFYFSILKSKTDITQINQIILYLKSAKYLMKYCYQNKKDLSKYLEFPIFMSIIIKILNYNFLKDDDIIKYYIAKIMKYVWFIFLEDNNYLTSLFNMGLMEAQMIIVQHKQYFIKKIGLETFKEIIECTLDYDLLIAVLNEQIIIQQQKISIIKWLITELQNNIDQTTLIKLEILNNIIQKCNLDQKIIILKSQQLIHSLKTLLDQEIQVEIHQQVIYLLESFILDQQDESITFIEIFKNFQLLSSIQSLLQRSKNKNLNYVIENFLQFFEFQL